MNCLCKIILKSFLERFSKMFPRESLNRNVGGTRRKLHSLYLGETNLIKVHKELTKAKIGP